MRSVLKGPDHPLKRWSERAARHLLACLLAALITVGAVAPALAANSAADPGGPAPQPASEAEMGLYQQFAAVNLCLARADGITMEQAVPLAAGTLAVLLGERHGGRLEALEGRQLGAQQLLSGSANTVLLAAAQLCPARLPEALVEKLREQLAEVAMNPAIDAQT